MPPGNKIAPAEYVPLWSEIAACTCSTPLVRNRGERRPHRSLWSMLHILGANGGGGSKRNSLGDREGSETEEDDVTASSSSHRWVRVREGAEQGVHRGRRKEPIVRGKRAGQRGEGGGSRGGWEEVTCWRRMWEHHRHSTESTDLRAHETGGQSREHRAQSTE
eukprot:3555420-Rhodomonas_salina.1